MYLKIYWTQHRELKTEGDIASHTTLKFQRLTQRLMSQGLLPTCTCSEKDNSQAWGHSSVGIMLPSMWKASWVEVGGSGIQGYPWLHEEFQAGIHRSSLFPFSMWFSSTYPLSTWCPQVLGTNCEHDGTPTLRELILWMPSPPQYMKQHFLLDNPHSIAPHIWRGFPRPY